MRMQVHLERDPVLKAALAARGMDPDQLPWTDCEAATGREVDMKGTPSIRIHSDGEATLRWWLGDREEGPEALQYDIDARGAIATLIGHETPDSLLAAMAGARLSELVDVQGADRMKVETAVNSTPFRGDPMDTRIAVVPDVKEITS